MNIKQESKLPWPVFEWQTIPSCYCQEILGIGASITPILPHSESPL